MTSQHPDHSSIGVIDGFVALTLVVYNVVLSTSGLFSHHPLMMARIRLVDAAFGFTFVFAWQYCFSILNLYDKFATISSRMTSTLRGVLTMTLPLVLHLFIFHRSLLIRRHIVTMVLALFCYEITRMAVSVYLLDRLAARDPRRAIILGSGRRASKAWREIRTRYHSSINLLGFVDDRLLEEMPPDVASRYLGQVDELSTILLKNVVDILLIAMPIQSCYPLMQRAVHLAESNGVQVVYLSDIYSTRLGAGVSPQTIFRELAPQQEHYLLRLLIKRVVDIFGSVCGLLVLSPFFLLVALAIRLTSNGPAFFCQDRYGYRRRLFRIIKFRSMVHNAEDLLQHLESSNEAGGPIFKMKNDPRVTKLGRILRQTSIDELPQLWNVLTGDMSLVGPRPMSVRDVSLFDEASLMRRFSVKPGMTGLWQVNGRSAIGFEDWMLLDARYIDRWSLRLDFEILFRTLTAVVRRSGAM